MRYSPAVAPAPESSGAKDERKSFPSPSSDHHNPPTGGDTPSSSLSATAQNSSFPMKSSEQDHRNNARNSFSTTDEETNTSVDEESGLYYNALGGATCDDDDDEDVRSIDDPYTYSDDSASLSDAYFLQSPPQPGSGGLFGLISDPESDVYPMADPTLLPQQPKHGNGGNSNISSLTNNSASSKRHRNHFVSDSHQGHTSSSLSTPIDEDEPVASESTSLLQQPPISVTSFKRRQDRKRRHQQKQQQKLRLQRQQQKEYIQQQQEERERAVTQVRGKRQAATFSDRFWMVLFVLQLLFVCYCAIRYGISLTKPSVTNLPAESTPTASLLYNNKLPMLKSLDPISNPVKVSKSAPLPYDHGQDTSLSTSFTTSTTQQNIIDHLQDDDSIQPTIPDDASENTKIKGKHKHVTSKSSSSVTTETGVTTTTTTTTMTEPNGSTTVVVENARFTVDYKNVLSLLLISGIYACIISYLSFAFMLIVARSLIAIMLVFTILLLLSWGVFGLTVTTYGGSVISILGFALFGLSSAYTIFSWNRIPFCSTNLYTAICAMRSSVLIHLAGILSLFVALLWLFVWSIALMGILNKDNGTDCAMWVVIRNGRLIELGVLVISLYWTTIVIKNVLRVTVADAVGSWWMQSDSTLFEPCARACTNSLGTICFGSLVALPAQILSVIVGCIFWATGGVFKKTLSWSATPTKRMSSSSEFDSTDIQRAEDASNEQEEMITAVAEKISQKKRGNCLRQFGRKIQACNRWSFTYVGMYNYSFIEGGEKAIELFETRQWMDVVRDNLIQNVLIMASIVIGGSSAVVAVVVEEIDGYTFTSMHKPIVTSFWIGFALGFMLSNILLLGVVGSAVNTVLVCFAAHPFEFDRNHPRLSREMREVWSQQVWEPDP